MDNKEVRDILLGRIVRQNEQFWTAAPSDAKFHFHGLKDGAGDVRLFGVIKMTRRYQTMELEADVAFEKAEKALNSMGRPIWVASMPKSKGCLYAPNWIAPVLLTVEQEAGDLLQMTAYTGRSLLIGHLRCRIAFWILEQRLPEGITCAGKSKKPDRVKVDREKPARGEKTPKREEKKAAPCRVKKAAPKRLKK